MTKEERNILLFLALGLGIGFVPEREHLRAPEDPPSVAAATPDSLAPPVLAAESAPDSVHAATPVDSSAVPETLAVSVDLYPIDVNHAELELLCELPGIGPSKATAILKEREQGGPFRTLDDLTRVKGIGPGTIRKFEGLVTFGTGKLSEHLAEDSSLGQPPTGNSPPGARDPQ